MRWALAAVSAISAAVLVQVVRLNVALPRDEHLAVALRIQPPTLWYRSEIASKMLLADVSTPAWCDLYFLKPNGIDEVRIPGAKLVHLLQIHEAHAAGKFKTLDKNLLSKLIDIGVERCDLNLQPNAPEGFYEFVGPHRALVYALMSGDMDIYGKLIAHGASLDFLVQSRSGATIPFSQFRQRLNDK